MASSVRASGSSSAGLAHPSMPRGWAGSILKPGEIGADGYMAVRTSANR